MATAKPRARAAPKRGSKRTPWERPRPKPARHTTLTPAERRDAARRAKRAGRHYPNLVDNMAETRKHRARKPAAKKRRSRR